MAIDFNKFGKSQQAGGSGTSSAVMDAPEATSTPAPAPTSSGIDFNKFGKSGQQTVQAKIPKEGGGALASFAKNLFSMPATMVARPVQATAALGAKALGVDLSNEQIDTATKKIPILGGLIAPTPNNLSDVKKDVGRAAGTVALGLSPIAGGALFGAGSSLEQGGDLLSAETALNSVMGGVLGGAGAKLMASKWVGRPIMNASGKVVGTITPTFIKNLASRGAGAVTEFAATHNLPGIPGIGNITAKPSAMLQKGAQAIDDTINTGISKVATGAKNVLKEQYPQFDLVKHYQTKNKSDFLRPTTVNDSRYSKASSVYDEAKKRNINLEDVATDEGIIVDRLAEGGKYNSEDTVEAIRQRNYKAGQERLRPALKMAEGETRRVPVSELREKMLSRIDDIPTTDLNAEDKAWMKNRVKQRYSDTSASARDYKNGYSLTDLHDNRIVAQKNGKYKFDGSHLENRPAKLSRYEGQVFADTLDELVPKDLPVSDYRFELEKRFRLADYLEQLHGRKVPEGMTKKAVRLFGRAVTATVGGKVGGFPGSILGAQYGDIVFNTFDALPNPAKMKILSSVAVEDPKVFRELTDYIQRKAQERSGQLLLPARATPTKTPESPLFVTPGGKVSPILSEATDIAAVESGAAKRPTTDRRSKTFKTRAAEAAKLRDFYDPNEKLPVIKAGRKPKPKRNLSDIFID